MINAVNWFEIPVLDFTRAQKFYSELFRKEVVDHPMSDPSIKYGILPYDHEKKGVGGAIIQAKDFVPSKEGVTLYLNGGEDLSGVLANVEPAGGKIIVPKTSIGENGFMAQFIDTEGNRLALHSMK